MSLSEIINLAADFKPVAEDVTYIAQGLWQGYKDFNSMAFTSGSVPMAVFGVAGNIGVCALALGTIGATSIGIQKAGSAVKSALRPK